MPYTKEDGGRLNNFPVEPKMYEAQPPSKNQQRNYVILGAAALLFVSGLLYVAFSVSSVS